MNNDDPNPNARAIVLVEPTVTMTPPARPGTRVPSRRLSRRRQIVLAIVAAIGDAQSFKRRAIRREVERQFGPMRTPNFRNRLNEALYHFRREMGRDYGADPKRRGIYIVTTTVDRGLHRTKRWWHGSLNKLRNTVAIAGCIAEEAMTPEERRTRDGLVERCGILQAAASAKSRKRPPGL
jgi:hypothetical protein